MSSAREMRVAIHLPGGTLYEGDALRLTAEASDGAFGLLPNHVDLVAALVPSVLLVAEAGGDERVFGIHEGLLVKKGADVSVAVRRGVESADLGRLRASVGDCFATQVDEERVARTALSRMKADMVRRFIGLRGEVGA